MNNRILTLAAFLLAPMLITTTACAQTPKTLLPADWNAKQAADRVMVGLINVTAPQVKGAHDAALVLASDRR